MANITVQSELDFIVSQLGPYFGVISKSAFMNFLVSGEKASTRYEVPDIDPVSNVGDIILNMQEGGMKTIDIVNQIAENDWGDEEDLLKKTFRVTYEKEGVDNASKCKVMNGAKAGAEMKDQGWPEEDVYSINKVLGKSGDDANVNGTPADPDKGDSPGLSVIQIFPTRLNPANRDTGALSIFLNALPTIEISRSVPFIDIVAITKTPMLSINEDGSGRITQMSLGQFLLGNDNVSGPSQIMMAGVDAAVAAQVKADDEAQSSDDDSTPSPVSTAGMEMFTSPQTLVNADELHYEFDTIEGEQFNTLTGEKIGETDNPGGRRAAPVIDRFRPFMSLTSFNINVAPSMGMMSYKTAEMSLVLHDRSRLSEIAPFVKPDSFNRTHFLIEYGWAHPDCKAHRFQSLGGASGNEHLTAPETSLFGAFIGSLRCKEKYKVINSSFSFDEVGQVEISVKLAMLPGGDQHQVKIGQGGDIEEQTKAVQKLTEAISEIRKKIGASSGSGDVGGDGDVLGVANSTQGAMNISKEDLNKIKSFLKKNRGKKNVEELEALEDSLISLYGKDGSGKSGAVAQIKKTIAAEVKRKIKLVKQGSDPWAVDIDAYTSKISKKSTKYVSLGKIVTIFLGLPISQTGKYDDVQIFFYSFNEHSSFVRDYNIAQFPIPVKDFEMMIKDQLKLEANMSVGKFFGWINKTFLKDQGTPAYGMTKIYGARDKEDKHKRKIASRFEKDSTAMFNEKQKILTKAYGEGENLTFKMPALQVKQECVPAANKTLDANGEDKPGNADSILRLHIYDKQATSYSALNQLLQAAKKSQIGLVTKSAGNVKRSKDSDAHPEHIADFCAQITKALDQGLIEKVPVTAGASVGGVSVDDLQGKTRYRLAGGFPAVKAFVMRSMPSARYGAQNSGILNASIQSMENPALATINMQRQGMGGGDQPQGQRDSGVPMRVHPVDCSIETIGCPLWDFGQQIFIDFGTGTTVDNIYAVVGIDHSISSGEFKSSVKMRQLSAWGAYSSMIDRISDGLTVIADATED